MYTVFTKFTFEIVIACVFFIYQIKLGKTCSEIKLYNPQATSGSYVIDPDGEGGYEPFTVHCDMTDKNGVGVTVVSHMTVNRGPWSKAMKVEEPMYEIFITQEPT